MLYICGKKKEKKSGQLRLVLKQLIKFLLTVDNQLRFPSNNGLNALSVYKRNDFFAKLLRSLEEKEETFQEEANVSRQFIISCACAFTYSQAKPEIYCYDRVDLRSFDKICEEKL